MKFNLALITGATSGIGEALSWRLAEENIPLILHGRNQKKLELLAKDLGQLVDVQTICADLTISYERQHVIRLLKERPANLVINNAGFGLYGDVLTFSTEEQMQMFALNAQATLELSIEAARSLVSWNKTGVILNVSSSAAFTPFPSFAIYSASKAFIKHFSESFDEELRPFGIRVLVACPGKVKTQFKKRASLIEEDPPDEFFVMTKEYAASEIWKQIQKHKQISIFDWRYRLAVFLGKIFVPDWLIKKIIRLYLLKKCFDRPILKQSNNLDSN